MANRVVDLDFNIILFVQVIISLLITGYLSFQGVSGAGSIVTMFLISASILTFLFLFIREEGKNSVFRLLKMPFSVDNTVAASSYLLGWVLPFLALPFGFLTGKYIVPLAVQDLAVTSGVKSLSSLQASLNPAVEFLITVWNAGTNEELLFGFVLVMAFGVISMFLIDSVFRLDLSGSSRRFIILLVSVILSSLVFVGAHKLNATYVSAGMFLSAFIFRFVLNLGIYSVGLILSFTVGLHQSINATYFLSQYGWAGIVDVLLSGIGAVIIVYFTLLIGFLVMNWDDVLKDWRGVWNKIGK